MIPVVFVLMILVAVAKSKLIKLSYAPAIGGLGPFFAIFCIIQTITIIASFAVIWWPAVSGIMSNGLEDHRFKSDYDAFDKIYDNRHWLEPGLVALGGLVCLLSAIGHEVMSIGLVVFALVEIVLMIAFIYPPSYVGKWEMEARRFLHMLTMIFAFPVLGIGITFAAVCEKNAWCISRIVFFAIFACGLVCWWILRSKGYECTCSLLCWPVCLIAQGALIGTSFLVTAEKHTYLGLDVGFLVSVALWGPCQLMIWVNYPSWQWTVRWFQLATGTDIAVWLCLEVSNLAVFGRSRHSPYIIACMLVFAGCSIEFLALNCQGKLVREEVSKVHNVAPEA
jgi:hypothetical protein